VTGWPDSYLKASLRSSLKPEISRSLLVKLTRSRVLGVNRAHLVPKFFKMESLARSPSPPEDE
jgi:hypothetical protein